MMDYLIAFLVLFWFAIPVAASVTNLLLKTRIHPVALYFATLVVGCFLVCVILWLSNHAALVELDRFDTDGNGRFSEEEMTNEALLAFEEFSRGGGSLESALACVLTGIWYMFTFLSIWIPYFLICAREKHVNSPTVRGSDAA